MRRAFAIPGLAGRVPRSARGVRARIKTLTPWCSDRPGVIGEGPSRIVRDPFGDVVGIGKGRPGVTWGVWPVSSSRDRGFIGKTTDRRDAAIA
jgi:hypothetical protein